AALYSVRRVTRYFRSPPANERFTLSLPDDLPILTQVWDGITEKFGVRMRVNYDDGGVIESRRESEEEAFEKIKEMTGIKQIDFKIGRAHVSTPVTFRSRMPSSA